MQKINQDAAEAFINDKYFNRQNTVVLPLPDKTVMELHGNRIAVRQDGKLWVSLSGWPTVTTRARLNAIPGVSIIQRDWVQYLNGMEMDVFGWEEV